MIFSARFARLAGVAVVAVPLMVGSVARADVKLTQTVTMKSTAPQGARNGNQTMQMTAYYKGNKIRQETPQQIVIMDGDSKQQITLNPAQKTYQVARLGALPQVPFMDMMTFDTKMSITPTGRTKNIVGKVAKEYSFTATIKMGMNAKGQQMMKAQGAPANVASMFPTMKMSGQTWATEAVMVPPIAAQASLAMLRNMPGTQNLSGKMGMVKGLPLESTMNMVVQGGAMAQRGGQAMQVSARTVTTQLSQAPVSASLFTVPAGYRKVTSAMPGMGGAGRMGGRAPMNR